MQIKGKKCQVRFSSGRKMCTQCRNDLEKMCLTEEFKEECDALLGWLCDVNITHTPSKANSDSYHVLSQSFNDVSVKDKQDKLKEFLKGVLRNVTFISSNDFCSYEFYRCTFSITCQLQHRSYDFSHQANADFADNLQRLYNQLLT